MEYIAHSVKVNEVGDAVVPYGEVVTEIQTRQSNTVVDVEYIFTDHSSVTVRYTTTGDTILKLQSGVPQTGMKE